MHPLDNHQPEYLNHVMVRFGHHLSVHQRQTFSLRFNGSVSSSSQGSRVQKKFGSVTTQHKLPPTNISSSIKPVIHMSRPSMPPQQKASNVQNKNDNNKMESDSLKQQNDVAMRHVSPITTASTSSSTDRNSFIMMTKNISIIDYSNDDAYLSNKNKEEQEERPISDNEANTSL